MFFGHLLFALVIALILAAVFGAGIRRHRWGADLMFFFILLFLFTWAGGIWITPFGPYVWGVPFFSFFLVGLLFALLLAALIPGSARSTDPRENIQAEREAAIAVDALFWVLIVGLLIAIIFAYV